MNISQCKILVCVGTGGVGKTTIAASLGETLARQGRRVLVLTIDPSRRLMTALQLQSGVEEVRVPIDCQGQGELWAGIMDPALIFDRFVRRISKTPEQAERLLKNRLYLELSRSLHGSQEFTALERLLEAYDSHRFDIVLLDTPPSQHAVDFLLAPQKIFSLFQDAITRWFIRDTNKGGLLQNLLHRGTRTVLGALERITGASFVSELSDFFQSISALQRQVADRSIQVHRLLSEATTGFVLVTAMDEAKLKEAQQFVRTLTKMGSHLAGIVVNRAFPEWLEGMNGEPVLEHAETRAFYQTLRHYHEARSQKCEQLARQVTRTAPLVLLPEFSQPVYGLEGLRQLSKRLEQTALLKESP